ncbi:hypothetical protein RvY_16662 [Ramazzottius varieornatus]|uniref:Uncharacterized protein n=1 Tax=Ramazzottius varieornatus TaxID=947166 RepID=A0A1D1W004_RAMVA|nr:hypothetical protein RvY_16662 [Ramazzottius varieornatus]
MKHYSIRQKFAGTAHSFETSYRMPSRNSRTSLTLKSLGSYRLVLHSEWSDVREFRESIQYLVFFRIQNCKIRVNIRGPAMASFDYLLNDAQTQLNRTNLLHSLCVCLFKVRTFLVLVLSYQSTNGELGGKCQDGLRLRFTHEIR